MTQSFFYSVYAKTVQSDSGSFHAQYTFKISDYHDVKANTITLRVTRGLSKLVEVVDSTDNLSKDQRDAIARHFNLKFCFDDGELMSLEYIQGASGALEVDEVYGQKVFEMDLDIEDEE